MTVSVGILAFSMATKLPITNNEIESIDANVLQVMRDQYVFKYQARQTQLEDDKRWQYMITTGKPIISGIKRKSASETGYDPFVDIRNMNYHLNQAIDNLGKSSSAVDYHLKTARSYSDTLQNN